MKVLQSAIFGRTLKKLHKNQKSSLDRAIRKLIKNPGAGQLKKGDLAGVRVYKFKLKTQQYLLAYILDTRKSTMTLLALGTHENFYRDIKR
ncbi:MAG: type II toxin-antitoxin system RelE/ParE family toxin [Gammaproteobacteria bacterium]